MSSAFVMSAPSPLLGNDRLGDAFGIVPPGPPGALSTLEAGSPLGAGGGGPNGGGGPDGGEGSSAGGDH